MATTETDDSKHYVLFIDVLYAVVVGETLFTYGEEIFGLFASYSISSIALIVTYVSIISSFIFWHKAISKYPHNNPLRFFVDIMVMVTYIGIVLNHTNLNVVFFGFVVLYSLYLVWDFLTTFEYKGVSRKKTSAINLVIVVILLLTRFLLSYWGLQSIAIDIITLTILLAFIIYSQVRDILSVHRAEKVLVCS